MRLDYLLSKLAKARAVLLQDEYDGGEYGTAVFVHGLITISDLNRQAFRALLYRMVSVLEVELARLIEKRFSEPWDWLKYLNEDAQVNVLGYWQLSERRGVGIGPLAATIFTHLLQIIEWTSPLLKELGYTSATDFKECRGRVCRLRNDIMHPIRPLILSVEDVKGLHKVIGGVIDLGQRVTSPLEERRGNMERGESRKVRRSWWRRTQLLVKAPAEPPHRGPLRSCAGAFRAILYSN